MPDLYDRLFVESADYDSIAVHSSRAALGDYAAGYTTRTQIVNYWDLDAEAQIDLDVLLARLDAASPLEKVLFLLEYHDVALITEEGAKYQTKAEFKTRMGL